MTTIRSGWARAKSGAYCARALPVRSGPPCKAVVEQGHNGWYFGLAGRGGRPLGTWQNGYETAAEAMMAAEGHAARTDNE